MQFKQLTKKQADTNQKPLIELSKEELEIVIGGGWTTQGHCDTYFNLLAAGQYEQARQFKKQHFS